jgi:hypothetical protein
LQISAARDNRATSMSAQGARALILLCAGATVLSMLSTDARAEWLAPLTVETAETIPSGQIDVALGASYFHNRRFPPFTPSGFIDWQDLTAVPELGLRAAVGSMVEIQASYEFLDLDERTDEGHHHIYGGGDARLFTKIYALRERTWIPAMGVRFGTKLPNANFNDRLGTDETDFFIQWLASKHFGDFTAHLNLGIALLGNPGFEGMNSGGQDDLFTYTIGLVSPTLGGTATDGWGVRFLIEEAGTAGSRFNNDGNAVRGGLQVLYGGLTLYAGASGGLNSAAEQFGVMGGVIYAFDVERVAALFE